MIHNKCMGGSKKKDFYNILPKVAPPFIFRAEPVLKKKEKEKKGGKN